MSHNIRLQVELRWAMDRLDWIPPLRLVPNRSNVGTGSAAAGGGGTGDTIGSKHYNGLLADDGWYALSQSAQRNHDDHDENDALSLADAVILIGYWARVRGLLRPDGLTEPLLYTMLSYLQRTRRIARRNTTTPSHQVLVAFLSWIAELSNTVTSTTAGQHTHVATQKGTDAKSPTPTAQRHRRRRAVLVMPATTGQTLVQTVAQSTLAQYYETITRQQGTSSGTAASTAATPPPTLLELYHTLDANNDSTPVLLDSTMTHNVWFRWTPSFWRAFSRHAVASLQCLHDDSRPNARPFVQMFGPPAPTNAIIAPATTVSNVWCRHDAYLRIPLSDIEFPHHGKDSTSRSKTTTTNASSSGGAKLWGTDAVDVGLYESLARGMIRVLSSALGDRVVDVQLLNVDHHHHHAPSSDDRVDHCTWTLPAVPPSFAYLDHHHNSSQAPKLVSSPTGSPYLILGLNLNPDTCFRVVDRGPPATDKDVSDNTALADFLTLWGPKAALRRFKDGAIVHAVVWDTVEASSDENGYICYHNDDSWQGGIVERIIRHILQMHFLKPKAPLPKFSLRDLVSTVDGVAGSSTTMPKILSNPLSAHRSVMKAMESLSSWLRSHSALTMPVPGSATEFQSALGMPLAIDAVEPLAPVLRYVELYPPLPHPLLGAEAASGMSSLPNRVSGAVLTDPIAVQIRFGPSSKWPTDLKAIGAAKAAMLVQLVNGIEQLKKDRRHDCNHFEGAMIVTPSHADIPFMGYVFRVFVRADPEVKLLRSLSQPNAEQALLLQQLTRSSIVMATHHALLHGVYTSHPSSSATVRMAKRWLSTHLLSDHVPLEAVELMVANVYTDRSSCLDPPGSVVAGFLRWLGLLAQHDWVREPLIVDPQAHLTDSDHDTCHVQFEKARGQSFRHGPAMYIISPCDHDHNDAEGMSSGTVGTNTRDSKVWSPSFAAAHPERVVLTRAVALAERTLSYLQKGLQSFDHQAWPGAFHETSESFRSYSALLRVDPAFVCNSEVSSSAPIQLLLPTRNKATGDLETTYTRSMSRLSHGLKALQRKLYRNLMSDDDNAGILLSWQPIATLVYALRIKFGDCLLLFYNDLCPDVLAVVWRPQLLQARPFSAVTCAYGRPVSEDWKSDTLITLNVHDILRDMAGITKDIVTDVKVFDNGPAIEARSTHTGVTAEHLGGRKRKQSLNSDASSESDQEDKIDA
jgi:U3 small nucleolar RNA-associated protein 22